MRTGADPDQLDVLARGGAGQAFALDHARRGLYAPAARYRARSRWPRAHILHIGDDLAVFTSAIHRLDAWVCAVAAALRAADGGLPGAPLQLAVLTLGSAATLDPLRRAVTPTPTPTGPAAPPPRDAPAAVWDTVPWATLADEDLRQIRGWPELPEHALDALLREQTARLATATAALVEVARAELDKVRGERDVLDRAAAWVDARLLDRLDPAITLHVSAEDRVEVQQRRLAGLRWVLRQPDLQLLDLSVRDAAGGTPTSMRLSLAPLTGATHVAVLVPGTGSGVANPYQSVRDLRALQAELAATAPTGTQPVAVLDLYDAPVDLGQAADTAYGEAAGAALAGWTRDQRPDGPLGPDAHVTLVGHSYGAFTAGQTAMHGGAVDGLVALGAPGLGALHADSLGLPADSVFAARAPLDPIVLVADLDEWVDTLRPETQARLGSLADPDAALGPDPMDAEFGARTLHTTPGPGDDGTPITGHLDYLSPGTASLRNVARVTLGLPQTPPTQTDAGTRTNP